MNPCLEYPAHRQSHTRQRYGVRNQPGKPLSALIFPRRKLGQSKRDDDAKPVWLTSDMIDGLADGPLSCAAKALGISPTALKKACRTLGVERWPYNRKSAKCDGSDKADSIDDEQCPPSPVPSAYSVAAMEVVPEELKVEDTKPAPSAVEQPTSWVSAIKKQSPFDGLVSDPFNDRSSLMGDMDFRFYFHAHEKASWATCENPHTEPAKVAYEGVDIAAIAHTKSIPEGVKKEDTGMSMGEHCLLHAKLASSASLWIHTPELDANEEEDGDDFLPSMYRPFVQQI